jgi:hypothetical protein
MVRRRGTPSLTWRSFLRNQAAGIAAIDVFVVASASFRLLYLMIIWPSIGGRLCALMSHAARPQAG